MKYNSEREERQGLFDQLSEQLQNCENERALAPFLKNNILLLRNTLNVHAWNHIVCRPEFRLGNKYIVDYIVLSADSGCWHVVLVEVQSHRDKIFNKNGFMTKQLNEAQKQIQEWKIWIGQNEYSFRQDLSVLVKGVPAQCSRVDIHTEAGAEIRDMQTVIEFTYKVLIGRREFLDQQSNQRRNQFVTFEIVTFDRLLDAAKRLDGYN